MVIDPAVRGKKLSVPLVLGAVAEREFRGSRKLTTYGEAALRKAWRVANGMEKNPWP